MWDEEDDNDSKVLRGYMNAFIMLVLVFMVIGTIWGLVTK